MSGPLGVLGGTFDPVHVGHLRMALELRESLRLDTVRMIPAAAPPHRGAPAATAKQRLAMLKAAIRGVAGLEADDCELSRAGPSYSVDTLTELRERMPRRSICLLLGMDAFLALPTWRRWREIPRLANIVVADRPGAPVPDPGGEVGEWLASAPADPVAGIRERSNGVIARVVIPPLPISATDLRARIVAGHSIRFLVPDAVASYIHEQHLYSQGH